MGPFLNINKIFDVSLIYSKTTLHNFKTHWGFGLHFNGVNIRLVLEVERGKENGKSIEYLFLFVTGMGVIGKALRSTDKLLIGTSKKKLLHLEKYFQEISRDTEDEGDDIEEVD